MDQQTPKEIKAKKALTKRLTLKKNHDPESWLNRIYNMFMVTYDENKRQTNLDKHGIDLANCAPVFDVPILSEEDKRIAYGEQRMKSLGWLNNRVVVLIWTERENGPHLISCRYGDKHETKRYFKTFF